MEMDEEMRSLSKKQSSKAALRLSLAEVEDWLSLGQCMRVRRFVTGSGSTEAAPTRDGCQKCGNRMSRAERIDQSIDHHTSDSSSLLTPYRSIRIRTTQQCGHHVVH